MDQDKIKPHSYDGIEEYDNQLPRWWVGTFVITVAFALVYFLYYQAYQKGPSQAQEYEEALEASKKTGPHQPGSGDVLTPALVAEFQKKPEFMSEAKAVYAKNCLACHGENAQGLIGPNLTDAYWLHGNAPEQIEHTIETGVLDKGMLAWNGIIPEDQIKHLVAYILSLQGSNPPNAKAPQGEYLSWEQAPELHPEKSNPISGPTGPGFFREEKSGP